MVPSFSILLCANPAAATYHGHFIVGKGREIFKQRYFLVGHATLGQAGVNGGEQVASAELGREPRLFGLFAGGLLVFSDLHATCSKDKKHMRQRIAHVKT